MSTWLWFPADFEIWLGNRFNNRRTERGCMFPPFWKQDSHWATVEFSREYDLSAPEQISIWTEGAFNYMLDGKLTLLTTTGGHTATGSAPAATTVVPAGHHKINIKIHNTATPPALFIQGTGIIQTDATWLVTHEDKIWIDELGVAHGSGIYHTPGFWHFDSPDTPPSRFQLARRDVQPVSERTITRQSQDRQSSISKLLDFGRETMGYIVLHGISGKGIVDVYYGESEAEALDREHCEMLDRFPIEGTLQNEFHFIAPESKAFRYVLIDLPEGMTIDTVSMQYEYLPQDPTRSGSFECSDDELNRIWQVGAYTMDLTTREFMMDGIKRDRWTWSGDAIQSYLMNYYLRFDSATVRRTIRQLRGKDPVSSHINTILDYTFYWFNSVYDYYMYTGDRAFVCEMYPRMLTLMDYCLGRLAPASASPTSAVLVGSRLFDDKPLWAIGQPDDWVFIDWVDFPMHKRGIVCFEQLLFCKSLETMQLCRDLVGDLSDLEMSNLHLSHLQPDGSLPDYGLLAKELKAHIDQTFWSDDHHAYLHAIEPAPATVPDVSASGPTFTLNPQVTKFPNMFAILYNYVSEQRQQQILEHVMQNPQIPAITTPYMRFYELAALCQLGLQADVLPEIKAYWGGMLREGATSFWEKYNPEYSDGLEPLAPGASPRAPHLTMYGRPYGKSLCHAWGASPVYLLGRYYLGVEPLQPGYGATQPASVASSSAAAHPASVASGSAVGTTPQPAYTVRPQLAGLDWLKGDVPTPCGPIHIQMDTHSVTVTAPQGLGTGLLIIGQQSVIIPAGQSVTLAL